MLALGLKRFDDYLQPDSFMLQPDNCPLHFRQRFRQPFHKEFSDALGAMLLARQTARKVLDENLNSSLVPIGLIALACER